MRRAILLLLFLVAIQISIFALTIYTASDMLTRRATQSPCYSMDEAISLYLCEGYGRECQEGN